MRICPLPSTDAIGLKPAGADGPARADRRSGRCSQSGVRNERTPFSVPGGAHSCTHLVTKNRQHFVQGTSDSVMEAACGLHNRRVEKRQRRRKTQQNPTKTLFRKQCFVLLLEPIRRLT